MGTRVVCEYPKTCYPFLYEYRVLLFSMQQSYVGTKRIEKGVAFMSSEDRSFPEKERRKKRKDAGQPRWEERDYYSLAWIGRQGIIRFDQLQRLLGRESRALDDYNQVLSPSATRNAVNRWEAMKLINSAYLFPGEPKYYWLSSKCFDLVELDLPHYRPERGRVPYLFACNQVRLYVELLNINDPNEFGDHMECYWISERELRQRDQGRQLHLPSAEFVTETRGVLAVEVEILPKMQTEQIMKDYIHGKFGAYAEVWYFATSEPLKLLGETREKLKQSGYAVSKIYTLNADTIIYPPPLSKRDK